MPIRPEHRHFYPIDWAELSEVIRFEVAGGQCQQCGAPHGASIVRLGDGRWFDLAGGIWRDGRGRPAAPGAAIRCEAVKVTRIVLATAHKRHDTSRNSRSDLAAWCQRCHLEHDRPEHLRRRRLTYLRRYALGDLFLGAYPVA
ncbi:hypothetical protein [Methylobacterium gnaphalii]|uniref:Uncharacterized protein n=1 Tax=Methylobacterium gnaphalii TaxID=1010610 RepID=A0A512JP97_9HYPH|nr:hypothetical protein [Methylobacterium gnaphalii]GEP11762.1 hypothetical protein MGN01_36070 [Methylobacterium gnaphalii]GJD69438.1 hypothetical protein MMMDOFMJ_2369 [Methylobacterium gnaphalii]GLS49603.1 hypothetical protein GCM10007885_24520 [Methylobacterium gnaphalii]